MSLCDLLVDISNYDIVCSIFQIRKMLLIFILSIFMAYLGIFQQLQLMVHAVFDRMSALINVFECQ